MKKLALLLFGFSVLLISCEKDGNNQKVVENNDIPLISKVIIGDQIHMEYVYNSSNLISEEKSKFFYGRHHYNENNQLVSSDYYFDMSMASSSSSVLENAMHRTEWVSPKNTAKTVSHQLMYNAAGELFSKSYIRTNDPNIDYCEFTWKNGKIVIETWYDMGNPSGHTEYIYDEKGNVTKKFVYYLNNEGVSELTTTTEYEYDDMHNPFQAFKRLMDPGVHTNPNNITKETYTLNFEVDPSIQKVQVTQNTYEYNYLGYPVKVNGTTKYEY